MFSLNFIFLSSLIEELCTKEENDKTGCKLNFGHECIITGEEVIYSKRKLKYYFLKIM